MTMKLSHCARLENSQDSLPYCTVVNIDLNGVNTKVLLLTHGNCATLFISQRSRGTGNLYCCAVNSSVPHTCVVDSPPSIEKVFGLQGMNDDIESLLARQIFQAYILEKYGKQGVFLKIPKLMISLNMKSVVRPLDELSKVSSVQLALMAQYMELVQAAKSLFSTKQRI